MADDGASSSSSSKSHFIYDVFLSFRGEIRHEFTDHLFETLGRRGIKAFRDDPSLRFGDEIRPTLLEAIERSRMSIVVFSQGYASSPWCLDELVKIAECMKKERLVFPIFYHVEPADVKHQKNQYEKDMMGHENGRNSHKVQAWRSALYVVGNLSGRHFKGERWETDFINKICEEILKYLPRELLHIKHPFELDFRFEEVKSLLDVESHDALFMLCVYGDGETDKTSFVGELCNMVFHKFEVAHLLENVSKKSKESIKGLEELQKALLSMIDRQEKTEIGSTPRGRLEIKRRLCNRRVLLILDDVDSIEQLESLAGGHDWFGLGSRIIITTRNEEVATERKLCGIMVKKYCIDKCEFEGMEAPKSNSKEEEGDIVGFKDSLSTVITQLKEENPFRNVVSITGIGGSGKTTLAKMIYDNNEVKNLFPYRAWGCVSKDFNEKKVLLELLNKSNNSEYEKLSVEELKKKVTYRLNRKKYLVVLDDIWETRVWDKVKDVFPNCNNGSMILITSRDDRVANYTRSRTPHHQLPPLNADEGWELFCKKVFGKEECPHDLVDVGKSIVKKCGGLPLAIEAMAGVVATTDRLYIEWSQIEGSVAWDLAQDSTKVIDALKMSYDHLSETLKPCFLYFGIYPGGYKIIAKELIQLWIAEGFIKPENKPAPEMPKPEVLGDRYLKELVYRNLVQVEERRSDGGVKICRIHDLLRELCIIESKTDNFLEVCTESTEDSLSDSCRLSLLCDGEHCMSLIERSQSSTRSLFFFAGENSPFYVVKDFPSLQVLNVGIEVNFDRDPGDLTMMTHLKYLRIGRCHIKADWIRSLDNLETLELGGWNRTISIWKLDRLKHLNIRLYARLGVDEEGASNKRMGNLQTLTLVRAEPQAMLLIKNGSFPNLTKLGLKYDPKSGCLLRELLETLHHQRKLRTLKIHCSLAWFSSDGIVFPSNISKITLTYFDGLDSGCMSALGRITSLQILKLIIGSTATDTLNVGAATGDFPQLQVFYIEGLSKVKRLLTSENGAMPHLQRVVIRQCGNLKEVPERLLSLCD